jgi:kynurenine formamidase
MPDSIATILSNSAIYDLEHSRYVGAPIFAAHWPGFVYTLHRRHEVFEGSKRTSASGMLVMAEHSGTHIDALSHQAIEMEMYGGIPVTSSNQTDRGFKDLGVETIPPIFRRGVLLDVAAMKGVAQLDAKYLITAKDLAETAMEFNIEIRQGDCVLVRTGWGHNFSDATGYLDAPGVDASGADWLAGFKPFLCGADNMAFDYPQHVDQELGLLPCHSILIVKNGIYIVENLNLEELSLNNVHEFTFLCLPLKMNGVTGSPVRPLAIVSSSTK